MSSDGDDDGDTTMMYVIALVLAAIGCCCCCLQAAFNAWPNKFTFVTNSLYKMMPPDKSTYAMDFRPMVVFMLSGSCCCLSAGVLAALS